MIRNRKGSTLIELVIVAAVIGILTRAAMPQSGISKTEAYVAAMTADLRNVILYEKQFAVENRGQYFTGTATMDSPLNGFTPSKDVTIILTSLKIPGSQHTNWSASARHSQSSERCELLSGRVICTTDNGLAPGLLPSK